MSLIFTFLMWWKIYIDACQQFFGHSILLHRSSAKSWSAGAMSEASNEQNVESIMLCFFFFRMMRVSTFLHGNLQEEE